MGSFLDDASDRPPSLVTTEGSTARRSLISYLTIDVGPHVTSASDWCWTRLAVDLGSTGPLSGWNVSSSSSQSRKPLVRNDSSPGRFALVGLGVGSSLSSLTVGRTRWTLPSDVFWTSWSSAVASCLFRAAIVGRSFWNPLPPTSDVITLSDDASLYGSLPFVRSMVFVSFPPYVAIGRGGTYSTSSESSDASVAFVGSLASVVISDRSASTQSAFTRSASDAS